MSSSHKMKTLTINGVQFTLVDETVGSLSDLNTTDKSSVVAAVNEVASNTGNGSGGNSVTIDATLTQEGQAADAKAVGDAINKLSSNSSPNVNAVEPAEDDIPKVFFGGPLQQVKEEAIVPFRYISKTQDISGYAEIKAQGNSSMSYPKKNQTVKLYKDAECSEKLKVDFKGWGKQNKFCFKANWIDLSHSRNVVSARLWGDIVKSRANYAELPELLRTSPNQGAIDGFPIKVFAAGVYQGRYTLNIPKDKWTFNMDDDLEEHCVLCGEGYLSGCFREASVSQWTDEIHDTMPSAIRTRWIEAINFVMNSTDEEFKANLDDYIDVQSAIDYHLFGLLSCGMDAYGKNQLFVTYDGQKWYASMYDMDSTWGLYWSGAPLVAYDYARENYQDMQNSEGNLLYMRLEQVFYNELRDRWEELKLSALSIENVINRFERFTDIAPNDLVKEDYAGTTADGKFSGIPSVSSNNIQQIRNFALKRMGWCDTYIDALIPVVEIPCTGITLSSSSLSFIEKTSQTLIATLEPSDATDEVLWESSNTDVVTVEDGVVTPVTNGTATITAAAGSVSAHCSVTVELAEVPCESIALNVDRLEFSSADALTLIATVAPENTTDTIAWNSSDKSVATVEDGVVTPVGSGTAVITATCGDQTAECAVTVNAKSIFSGVTWSTGNISTSTGEDTGGTGDVNTGYVNVADYQGEVLIITLNGADDNSSNNKQYWYDETQTFISARAYSVASCFGGVVPDSAKYMRMALMKTGTFSGVKAYKLVRNETKNVFKTAEVISGYLDANNGEVVEDAYTSHIKIPVEPGETYEIGYAMHAIFYNDASEFVSGISGDLRAGYYALITVPEGAAYMATNVRNTAVATDAYLAKNENTEFLGELEYSAG